MLVKCKFCDYIILRDFKVCNNCNKEQESTKMHFWNELTYLSFRFSTKDLKEYAKQILDYLESKNRLSKNDWKTIEYLKILIKVCENIELSEMDDSVIVKTKDIMNCLKELPDNYYNFMMSGNKKFLMYE